MNSTVLHNFDRQNDAFDFEITRTESEINYFPNVLNAKLIGGGSFMNIIRITSTDYFVSDTESFPWYDEAIGL